MNEHSNRNSKAVVVIVILAFIVVGLAGAWYWVMYIPEQEAKEKARQEQMAKEAAEKKAAEQAAQNEAKYKELIEDADSAFEQEDWESARALYTEASSLFPGQPYPKDQLALVNAKLDEIAALEAKRAAGIVETVSSSTGRFYIIVSSSIDDDLAMDYANKLAQEGNNVKIIEHDTDKHLYYRVSVGDYAAREAAEAALASYSNFGKGVWVLEY